MQVNLEVPQHFFKVIKEISGLKLHCVIGEYEEKLESTLHKKKFPVKDFSSKCGQLRRKLRIKTFLTKNFIF